VSLRDLSAQDRRRAIEPLLARDDVAEALFTLVFPPSSSADATATATATATGSVTSVAAGRARQQQVVSCCGCAVAILFVHLQISRATDAALERNDTQLAWQQFHR
jgi:hypothetical protein